MSRRGSEVKTIGGAWQEFRRHRSPWIIWAGIAAYAVLRVALGSLRWSDAIALAAMVAIYPFAEWAIHVYLLHLRPFRWRGREVELVTSKSHRQHHERPDHLGLILLGPIEAVALLIGITPLVIAVGCGLLALAGVGVPFGAAVTAGLTGAVLIAIYEWTHFLIHTAHRPRTRYFRSVHRTHRLHHYKNEHFWHGITNTAADRVLGTFPEQREVPRSPTARTLAQ